MLAFAMFLKEKIKLDWFEEAKIGPDCSRLVPEGPDWPRLLEEAKIDSDWPQKGPDCPQEVYINIHTHTHNPIHVIHRNIHTNT